LIHHQCRWFLHPALLTSLRQPRINTQLLGRRRSSALLDVAQVNSLAGRLLHPQVCRHLVQIAQVVSHLVANHLLQRFQSNPDHPLSNNSGGTKR
jgi:hypothetical protein